MNFKNFLTESMDIKLPKPHSTTHSLNIQEYKELISKSKLKKDKKTIVENITKGGEIPFFVESVNKCFIINLKDKSNKVREVKSREDKVACGVLINALCVKENNSEKYKNINFGWEIPPFVWKK
jgi:hypothetical protein